MDFIRWLISSVLGIVIGASLIGVVLFCVFVLGPVLAVLGCIAMVICFSALGISEYLESRKKKK